MLKFLEQRATRRGWRMIILEETMPVETYHRQDGTELDDKCEGMNKRIALRHTQKILSDNHVTCRRYRQKLCQSLNDSNNNCL